MCFGVCQAGRHSWIESALTLCGSGRRPTRDVADFLVDAMIGTHHQIECFEAAHAEPISRWVASDHALFLLAPMTHPPLTPGKVTAWSCHADESLVLVSSAIEVLAYGVLNQMRLSERQRWIGHLVVAPEWRGRGVGRRFVLALLERTFAIRDVDSVSLVVCPWNGPAVRCYQQLGFEQIGIQRRCFLESLIRHDLLEMKLTRRQFRTLSKRRAAAPAHRDEQAA